MRSLFYLLITAHYNSNFLKVIKKFRSKIQNKQTKKKNASYEISPTLKHPIGILNWSKTLNKFASDIQ